MEHSIIKLAKIFQEYKIYPNRKYKNNTPVHWFLQDFKEDSYTKDLKEFLKYQDYNTNRRGADLPWWGEKYFSSEKGIRVMIISQDSLAEDAKSIVFYANMLPHPNEFKNWEKKFKVKKSFYDSWNKFSNLLESWNMDFRFIYMTDARKVYKQSDKKNFDNKLCKELLIKEIDICNPELIICLGRSAINLLYPEFGKNKLYELINSQLYHKNRPVCVSYFPTGRGFNNFKKYRIKISECISKYLNVV